MSKPTRDYPELLKQAQGLIASGQAKTWADLARLMKIHRRTLADGFEHLGIQSFDQITSKRDAVPTVPLIGTEHASELEVEIAGNDGEVRSLRVLDQIKTVDELLKLAGVSDEFTVHNPEIKKWDVVLKIKKDKDWEEIGVVPSIYIKAPLRRKVPIAFEPVISPIEIQLPKHPPKKKDKSPTPSVKRALIVNDPQIGFRRTLHTTELHPFHDRRVLDLALQICEEEQIDHVAFGGDWLDMSEWSSKYMPEPEFYWTTQPALLETAWWLAQFRTTLPEAEINLLEGNHDLRMPNLVVNNLRQAYKLRAVDELDLPPQLTIPRLLALHSLNVEYVDGYPDNGYWLNRSVYITHGDVVRSQPGGTANAITTRQAFTTIFGHIHRRESVTRRMKAHDGDIIYTAFCPGCACHIDGRVPGSKSDQQWQQGIAIIEYTESSENIIPIAIKDGRMIYNGRVWTARERDGEINTLIHEKLSRQPE